MRKETKKEKKRKKKKKWRKKRVEVALGRTVRIAARNCMRFCMGDVTLPFSFWGGLGREDEKEKASRWQAGLRREEKKRRGRNGPARDSARGRLASGDNSGPDSGQTSFLFAGRE